MHCLHVLKGCHNIVTLLGINTYVKDGESHVLIHMSYHKSNMSNFITSISIDERVKYFDLISSQLFHALSILYNYNILHRDIKPDNILIDYECNVAPVCYLADFGFSYQLPGTHTIKEIDLSSSAYTVLYRPPEIFAHKKYDYSADIWVMGIVLIEYLTGEPITNPTEIEGELPDNIQLKILETSLNVSDERLTLLKSGLLPDHVHVDKYVGGMVSTDNIIKLESMLKFLPTDRIHITKLVQKSNAQSISKMLPRKIPLCQTYDRYYETTKWMINICNELYMNIRVLICAIDIRDRYTSLCKMDNDLLISLGCIMVADKIITDVNNTHLDEYISISGNMFTANELKVVEQDIMKALNYILVSPEIDEFVNVLEKFPNINFEDEDDPQPNDVSKILKHLYKDILLVQNKFISQVSYDDMISMIITKL